MANLQDLAAVGSSTAIRISAYILLRWIPAHALPPTIFSLFAIYVPSFIASFFTQAQYSIGQENVQTISKETNVKETGSLRDTTKHLEKNIVMKKKVALKRTPKQIWWTFIAGLPNHASILASLTTFLINLGLIVAVTDFVYRARVVYPSEDLNFARIGYISPNEVSLLVREPNSSVLPIFVSYRLADALIPTESTVWQTAGTITSLDNSTDYTGTLTFPVSNRSDGTYQWITSNNHSGFFTMPPKAGEYTKNGEFTFLTSSCLKPRFPYNPQDHVLAVPGFKYMSRILKLLPRVQFMLFLGDFIYIDSPKRFGTSVEDYRREYRQVYASPDWPSVGQNLSWIHVLDDHEIANDWDANTTGVYNAAIDPWHHYQTSVNPPRARQAGKYSTLRAEATYFEFTQGPASFFMLDTRTYRDSSKYKADSTGKSMLGSTQLADLLAFLAKPEPEGVSWKFVISSIPFTKNWRVGSLDTWAGYLSERQIILESMWDVGLRGGVGVVILSGDRHEFAATAFPPPKGGNWPISATVHEFSTSPLSQFYLPTPTYRQTDNEDVMIKYVPKGNSKIGAVTIQSKSSNHSIILFRLFIDGEEVWSNFLSSPPTTIEGK